MIVKITVDSDEMIEGFHVEPRDQALLETDMINIQDWVYNALSNKLRQVKDWVIYQDGFLATRASAEERDQRIDEMIKEGHPLLKSGKQKNEEAEALLKEKELKPLKKDIV